MPARKGRVHILVIERYCGFLPARAGSPGAGCVEEYRKTFF